VGLPFFFFPARGHYCKAGTAHLILANAISHPIFLYALSNAGSVLGLLSYPFFWKADFSLKNSELDLGSGFHSLRVELRHLRLADASLNC